MSVPRAKRMNVSRAVSGRCEGVDGGGVEDEEAEGRGGKKGK